MELSIVIVSFNTCDVTRRCLEAIMAQARGLEYEIIVVDNASSDDTVAMIRNEFPSVKIICNTGNKGFAAGQNTGLKQAQGEYLMILNSDVILLNNAASILVERLCSGPSDVGVVGPRIQNPDGSLAPSARRAILSKPVILLGQINRHFRFKRFLPEKWLRRYFGFILGRWHDNYARHEQTGTVDFVDGMCLLVKRAVLEQVGLFDEQFFFDWEITDLSNRIRAGGWKIEFYPEAQVIHLGHSSRRQMSRIIVESHRSELIYYAKHAPDLVPFVRRVALCVVSLKRLGLKAALFFGKSESRQQALNICDEIISVIRHFNVSVI